MDLAARSAMRERAMLRVSLWSIMLSDNLRLLYVTTEYVIQFVQSTYHLQLPCDGVRGGRTWLCGGVCIYYNNII
jgi:hypothetical protein